MVTTKKSGVYQLLLMCHAAINVRIKFLAALSLLYYFMKLLMQELDL